MPGKRKKYVSQVCLPDLRKAPDTLCWDCKKALNSGCSWCDPSGPKPVKGWEAKKTKMGYNVKSCPEFDRGTWCRGRYRTAEDYISALEEAVVNKTHLNEKYKQNIKFLREELARLKWQVVVHMGE